MLGIFNHFLNAACFGDDAPVQNYNAVTDLIRGGQVMGDVNE
jgi:hypothetical protein